MSFDQVRLMNESWFAEYLTKPVDGPEHESLREELWIGGSDVACCYYLGMLTNQNYFARPLDDLWRDITDYVVRHASPDAIAFAHNATLEMANFALPFLKDQFDHAYGTHHKRTKEHNGMVLLLKNPGWTDEQIRAAVNTTEKQMHRWSWYRRARAVQRWHENSKRE